MCHVDWSSWTTKNNSDLIGINFVSCLRNNLLLQHVNCATRARGSAEPHILDLVISNDDFIGDINYLSPLGKSDHSVLNFVCKLKPSHVCTEKKLNYNKGDYDGLRRFMNRDWEQTFGNHLGNVNSLWTTFKSILNDGIKKYIPITVMVGNRNRIGNAPYVETLRYLFEGNIGYGQGITRLRMLQLKMNLNELGI